MQEVKELYPAISKFGIDYNGSGDSFDSFYEGKIDWNDSKPHDSKEENELYELLLSKFEDVMWEIIESVGADFNNDGSRGTIYFDFDKLAIGGDVYWYEQTTTFGGSTSFVGELEIDDDESE